MKLKLLLLLGLFPGLAFAEAPQGCLVGSVGLETPADTAGVKAGDIITEAAGHPVGSVEDLQGIVSKAGSELSLKLRRGTATLEANVRWTDENKPHKLGIRCGPVTGTALPSVSVPEPTPFKAAPAVCPYAVAVNTRVQVTFKDGSTLNGKLLACDGGEIALRTGLMYRVFKLEKVTGLTSR